MEPWLCVSLNFHLSGMSAAHRLAGAANRCESRSFDAWHDRWLEYLICLHIFAGHLALVMNSDKLFILEKWIAFVAAICRSCKDRRSGIASWRLAERGRTSAKSARSF